MSLLGLRVVLSTCQESYAVRKEHPRLLVDDPKTLMDCALAACVERAAGRDAKKYVELILKHWGDGSLISNQKGSIVDTPAALSVASVHPA
jgi:hypothetical protein